MAQVARELGISTNTLYRWKAEYVQHGKQAFPGSGNLSPADQAMRGLQKQIRELQEENEVLALLRKRPALIFSFIHNHRFKLRVVKMYLYLRFHEAIIMKG
ncbi:transposase [Paenibacillus sp. FSL R10-2748]|uniref:transposase n=1 Tax=unclassified Paenibacillus TaxID=185978 RepID=UPI004046EB6D